MDYWVSTDAQSPVEESARVAQVMDQLEKRDKTIDGLRRENAALKVCTVCVCVSPCENLTCEYIVCVYVSDDVNTIRIR